ncbi:hypothetical protein CTAYLR_004800 [Chrysophaeum taylorii]|uniref:Alpha-1,3/1,6-mannosyltransferase ALG2 n=1 Tax=Chrysophaeum taylorii TaxID=2483200 RepID=A0AAD7UMU6_9STRA|nr:hypothetical protein CTAYLR_004800 [Chrysophaeum taylorii]
MKVAFVHPDLGLGGAERLIVDAAMSLQELGHEVVIYTAHHDPSHAFPETTRALRVCVRGDFLPREICGRGHVLCASVRNAYTAACLALSGLRADVVIVDQISTCVPILRAIGSRVIFYVHFPDKLLASRGSWLRRVYRFPFDLLEELTTGCAHRILVNSRFTAAAFRGSFRFLARRDPDVLYPSVALPSEEEQQKTKPPYLVSLNRYERKKRVDLAIEALALVEGIDLAIAGGYDTRVLENVEYHEELRRLAADLGLQGRVVFERSISDARRVELLRSAVCLVYTPPEEHFGIVPLEAMALGCPVLAVNSGGPLETVVDGTTGFLVDADPRAFACAIQRLLDNPRLAADMRRAARDHIRSHFARPVFAARLEAICADVSNGPRKLCGRVVVVENIDGPNNKHKQ